MVLLEPLRRLYKKAVCSQGNSFLYLKFTSKLNCMYWRNRAGSYCFVIAKPFVFQLNRSMIILLLFQLTLASAEKNSSLFNFTLKKPFDCYLAVESRRGPMSSIKRAQSFFFNLQVINNSCFSKLYAFPDPIVRFSIQQQGRKEKNVTNHV